MTSLDSYEKGKNYQEANNSYVIFFCCFDPLGLGLQQYTIHRHVDESPEHIADDGTTTIFLNIPSLRKDVNQPLQKFLDVIANRKVDGDDRFIVQLKKRIAFVKHNKKWRAEYKRLSLYEMDRRHGLKVARQEGIEEGKEKAILQVTSLFIKQQLPKERIIANLKEAYDLTDEEAEQYYKRCLK
ncbi:Rpn family recombination-promoting nuclease/putative transposase [Limosilactobacillus vaginalis]|uniref:Rpn family recombination-promoting nuclease/putative transposase n=1 Tax=Limosilactobacillus vaginalis TaxID=1633 RepID=A0AAW5WR79_9LACO|nr:Rpn family recombination-promoting nuclease/putative transposase [Limosilactobacillus vaginalis]MCZ3666827.1 Rpn family recombination-promoting nuclease/putative transposase [Limosilactobacillus vaginalis]